MREAFVHEATLALDPGADIRAPGGAVTLELCGQWEHEPPCPLAPHHTRADRAGEQVELRILFASEQADELGVRSSIERALARGKLQGPDGVVTRWRLEKSGPGVVTTDELPHVQRLMRS